MIELKPQLSPLTYPDGLKTFLAEQQKRRSVVNAAVIQATAAIDKARKDIHIPDLGHEKRVGAGTVKVLDSELLQNTQILMKAARIQTVRILSNIRASLDEEIVPVIKDMHRASDTAIEMRHRHFDRFSVLRRARGIAKGLIESTQLRACYTEILSGIEPRELAAFAQQAIDTGDAVLADCIQRENFTRPKNERAFVNVTFIELLPSSEFDESQALLRLISQLYEEANLQFAQFGREIGAVSLQRMALHLNYGNVKLSEDGSIINPQGGE